MSQRTLIILLALFVVVTGLYFFTSQKGHEGAKSLLTPLGKKAWLEADEIDVYFQKPEQGFALVKEDQRWIIRDDYPRPAKDALVNKLLQDLADLYGEKRAQGEKYFSRFKLQEDQALHLVLKKDGQVLAHILLGKRGPLWESNFLRFKDGQEIYLVSQNFLSKFGVWKEEPGAPQFKDLVDLKILDLPPKEVKLLALSKGDLSWKLVRKKDAFLWQKGEEEKELKEEQVATFLRKVFPLLAQEVVPPNTFGTAEGELRYETTLGTQGALLLGPCAEEGAQEAAKAEEKKPKKVFCLVKKGPFVYKVAQTKLTPLFDPKFE